jgi:hypothetical protein
MARATRLAGRTRAHSVYGSRSAVWGTAVGVFLANHASKGLVLAADPNAAERRSGLPLSSPRNFVTMGLERDTRRAPGPCTAACPAV